MSTEDKTSVRIQRLEHELPPGEILWDERETAEKDHLHDAVLSSLCQWFTGREPNSVEAYEPADEPWRTCVTLYWVSAGGSDLETMWVLITQGGAIRFSAPAEQCYSYQAYSHLLHDCVCVTVTDVSALVRATDIRQALS